METIALNDLAVATGGKGHPYLPYNPYGAWRQPNYGWGYRPYPAYGYPAYGYGGYGGYWGAPRGWGRGWY